MILLELLFQNIFGDGSLCIINSDSHTVTWEESTAPPHIAWMFNSTEKGLNFKACFEKGQLGLVLSDTTWEGRRVNKN